MGWPFLLDTDQVAEYTTDASLVTSSLVHVSGHVDTMENGLVTSLHAHVSPLKLCTFLASNIVQIIYKS